MNNSIYNSHELRTAFLMWRKTLNEIRQAYIHGYLSKPDFISRLECMGFLPHEIEPELEYVHSQLTSSLPLSGDDIAKDLGEFNTNPLDNNP